MWRVLPAIAALALIGAACGDVDTDASPDDPTGEVTTTVDAEPAGGGATLTVGDRTYELALDQCFMTADGLEARGTTARGEVLEVQFFLDDPGTAEIYLDSADGEALWASNNPEEVAPQFDVDEESGGFTATASFTGADGGIEDGRLSGSC